MPRKPTASAVLLRRRKLVQQQASADENHRITTEGLDKELRDLRAVCPHETVIEMWCIDCGKNVKE